MPIATPTAKGVEVRRIRAADASADAAARDLIQSNQTGGVQQ